MDSGEYNEIPEPLIEYIVKTTGVSKDKVEAVLRAERKYYLGKLVSIE